jgi:site-specific DNA recombinase
MKTTAIAYIRVSSKLQAEEGTSLLVQEEKIRKYAELNDIEIIEVFKDEGISGYSGKKRPGFEKVMEIVREKKVQSVIVYSISRFARNTRQTLESVNQMTKNNIEFHSVTEKIDTGSAQGKFFLTVISALAELESAQTGERIKDNMAQNKKNGRVYSAPVFGYDNDKENHKLIPNEERKIVEEIILLKASNSYHEIARTLNEKNIPTKKGGKWYGKTVYNVINNSINGKAN